MSTIDFLTDDPAFGALDYEHLKEEPTPLTITQAWEEFRAAVERERERANIHVKVEISVSPANDESETSIAAHEAMNPDLYRLGGLSAILHDLDTTEPDPVITTETADELNTTSTEGPNVDNEADLNLNLNTNDNR